MSFCFVTIVENIKTYFFLDERMQLSIICRYVYRITVTNVSATYDFIVNKNLE